MFTTQSNFTLVLWDVELRYTVSGFLWTLFAMTNLSIAAVTADDDRCLIIHYIFKVPQQQQQLPQWT